MSTSNAITPPYSLETEQNILGGLLKDVNFGKCREVLDSLGSEAFYSTAHRKLFRTIKAMAEAKQSVDLITVKEVLSQQGELDNVGGFVYLAEMMKQTISLANITAYADLVRDYFVKRELVGLASSLSEQCYGNASVAELVNHTEQQLALITKQDAGKAASHISEFAEGWLEKLDQRFQSDSALNGLATGIAELDERLSGFDDESLIILAGRPSMGKTLLAQEILANVGIRDHKPCMFFSMEMSDEQVFGRFVSNLANVGAKTLRSGNLTDADWGRLAQGMETLNNSNLFLDADPKLTVGQIRARIRKQVAKFGKQSLIVIDYLGLMRLPKADRHDLAIAEVTSSLKNLAKEIKTPILLLVQANRDLDKAKRPTMSNLKDSSAIEADADVIMFVHRQEVLEPETELKGVTELIIAKDRHNDGNGTVYLEKVAGGFRALDTERLAFMDHAEQQRSTSATGRSFTFMGKGAK